MNDNVGTSVCIDRTRLDKLRAASKQLGRSETELLSILIWKSRRLFGNNACTRQTVKYQRNNGDEFVIHHVILGAVDYEFVSGRRYLFKISVSFILRLSIDAFLDEILEEMTKETAQTKQQWRRYRTNSHYVSFDIEWFVDFESEFWVIPWPR